MLARLEHVAHAVEPEVSVDVGDADSLDVLHHADGDVDARDELVERELRPDVLVQPAERDLHA
jgi:hypothetical protein